METEPKEKVEYSNQKKDPVSFKSPGKKVGFWMKKYRRTDWKDSGSRMDVPYRYGAYYS